VRRFTITRVTTVTALCGVAGAILLAPFTAIAQENAGGLLMKLRLGERFVQRETESPDVAFDGTTTQLITDLDLSLRSETRTQMVELTFGTGYRFFEGPTTDGLEQNFVDPTLRLTYKQVAARSSLQTSLTAMQVDLADVSPFTLSDAPDGGLVRDFSQLTDGGTRTALSFGGTYTWRDDAPFGISVDFDVSNIAYRDLPSGSTLDDSLALALRPSARFDLSPVLQANLGLRYTTTDFATAPDVTRYGIDASASLAQPNGSIDLRFSSSDGDGGVQNTLGLSRTYELPRTTARFGLGLSQAAESDVYVTGSASLKHDFAADSAFGSLTATANRDVAIDGRSNEEILTSLSLSTDYAITPVARLLLSADVGQAEEARTGTTVDQSALNLSLRYDLSDAWQATAGLRTTHRDPSDIAPTTRTTLSLGVSRSFEARP